MVGIFSYIIDIFRVIALLLTNKESADKRLSEALKNYDTEKPIISATLELENAFHKRYKKTIPAPTIIKLANFHWGPKKAFEIFSISSYALHYEIISDKMISGYAVDYKEKKLIFGLPSLCLHLPL